MNTTENNTNAVSAESTVTVKETLKELFQKAVDTIKSKDPSEKTTNVIKLKYYSHYKQAIVGPCSLYGGEQPSYFYLAKRQMWDSWSSLKDMTREDAMAKYCEMVDAYEYPDQSINQ